MHGVQMIKFVKGVGARLPVGRPNAAYMTHSMHLFNSIDLKRVRQRPQKLAHRPGIVVHVHKNQPRDDLATQLGQVGAMAQHFLVEGFGVGDFCAAAVQ